MQTNEEGKSSKHSSKLVPIAVAFLAIVPSLLSYYKSSFDSDQKAKFNYETCAKQVAELQDAVEKIEASVTNQNLAIAKIDGRSEERMLSSRPVSTVQSVPTVQVPVIPQLQVPEPKNQRRFKSLKQNFNEAYDDAQKTQQLK